MSRKPSLAARSSDARHAPSRPRRAASGPPATAPADHSPSSPTDVSVSSSRVGHGIARLELDQAAERVRAVARALRAAQHLDLLDVEQRGDHADAAEVDLVDQEADRRIGRALVLLELADSAQLEVARARAGAGPGQRRKLRQQLLEVHDAGLVHRRPSEHRDAAGTATAAGTGRSVAVTTTGSSFAACDAAPATQRLRGQQQQKNDSSLSDTPAPYAGPNRIRFNGFAGRYRHLRSLRDHPKAESDGSGARAASQSQRVNVGGRRLRTAVSPSFASASRKPRNSSASDASKDGPARRSQLPSARLVNASALRAPRRQLDGDRERAVTDLRRHPRRATPARCAPLPRRRAARWSAGSSAPWRGRTAAARG